jgi:hypothetical protein
MAVNEYFYILNMVSDTGKTITITVSLKEKNT